ncbi:hypothetical protein PLANTIT3_80237 [Plantibacter sp. T3]|nr:hypothetical protein PLANTIT3_80237 [Plantibacter sp. T3]
MVVRLPDGARAHGHHERHPLQGVQASELVVNTRCRAVVAQMSGLSRRRDS